MRLLPLLLLSLALPAGAQIYQYKDANGNTVYTDQLPEGQKAKTVDLPPANQVKVPAASQPVAPKPSVSTAQPYQEISLIDLPSEEALRVNNGTFSVRAQLTPALRTGHQLQLVLDGQPYGAPSAGTVLQLTQIDRGDHTLAVQVLAGNQVVQSSAPVTFTVQRVHLGTKKATPH